MRFDFNWDLNHCLIIIIQGQLLYKYRIQFIGRREEKLEMVTVTRGANLYQIKH